MENRATFTEGHVPHGTPTPGPTSHETTIRLRPGNTKSWCVEVVLHIHKNPRWGLGLNMHSQDRGSPSPRAPRCIQMLWRKSGNTKGQGSNQRHHRPNSGLIHSQQWINPLKSKVHQRILDRSTQVENMVRAFWIDSLSIVDRSTPPHRFINNSGSIHSHSGSIHSRPNDHQSILDRSTPIVDRSTSIRGAFFQAFQALFEFSTYGKFLLKALLGYFERDGRCLYIFSSPSLSPHTLPH